MTNEMNDYVQQLSDILKNIAPEFRKIFIVFHIHCGRDSTIFRYSNVHCSLEILLASSPIVTSSRYYPRTKATFTTTTVPTVIRAFANYAEQP